MAHYPCPLCGGKMHIDVIHEGYEVPCPHCDQRFRVPHGAAGAGAAAPSVAPPAMALEPDDSPSPPTSEPAPRTQQARPVVVRGGDYREPRRPIEGIGRAERGPNRPADSRATLALVLGIVGFVVCPISSPFAWYYGMASRAASLRAGERPDGLATAGWVLGMIGTGILLLYVLVAVFFLVGSVTFLR